MTKKIHSKLSSHEAEESVLGAIIVDASILGWLTLSDDHFNLPLHLRVYRAMVELYEADKPIDEITLLDRLGNDSGVKLSDVSRLAVRMPTADNAEHWADILEEHRKRRVLSRALSEANKRLTGEGSGTCAEIQDGLLADLAELSSSGKTGDVTMESAADQELARMETQWEGGDAHPRLKTGVFRLDDETGGVPIGVLSALGARPGVGKSTMLWNFCYNQAHRGDHTLVLTNEDKPNVSARLGIANVAGIERIKLLSGEISSKEKYLVRESIEVMRAANSRYHTLPIHGKKMREICREATALIRRYDIKFVALDYIQNVPNPDKGMNRNYGIEDNLTVLEAMVASEEIAFMVVGQLKRSDGDRRPQMDDFKDSGSIEQKCKLMMILSDGEYGMMDVDIVKNSEGRTGGTVSLDVDKGLGRVS